MNASPEREAERQTSERRAWADYWADMGVAQPGCLPHQEDGVEKLLKACWRDFAASLPRGGRVLDIGTGNGVVLVHLSARRDLKLIGVDTAPRLPPAPKNVRLLADVAAEELPFAEARFDAVVSQFGFEYARIEEAAGEVARILKPGGKIRMVIHHRGSPILAHNMARRAAIAWLRDDERLLERARGYAKARALGPLPLPEVFAEAPMEAHRRFPSAGAGAELAEAIRRTLLGGSGRPVGEVLEVLAMLERKAEGEVVRVDSLARAARASGDMDALAGLLADCGIVTDAVGTIGAPENPLAWLLDGQKGRRTS